MTDLSEQKKTKYLEKLNELVRKAQNGRASLADIDLANELNESLGGFYSGIVTQISSAVSSRSTDTSAEEKLDPIQKGNKILEEDREYFNSEPVKKSNTTLSSIAKGESSKVDDLVHAVSNLSDPLDREYRNKKFNEIKDTVVEIYTKAFDEARELSREEHRLVENLLHNHKEHLSRHHQDEAFTKIVGEHKNPESLTRAVKAKKTELEEASRSIQNEGLREASVLLDKGHNSIMEILKASQLSSPEARAAARPKVIQMAAGNFDSSTKTNLSPHIRKMSPIEFEDFSRFIKETPISKVDRSKPLSSPTIQASIPKKQTSIGHSQG